MDVIGKDMRVIVQYDPAARLGNRMFQYAYGYILSKKYNCKLFCNEPLLNFDIDSNPITNFDSKNIKTRDYGEHSFDDNLLENFDGDIIVNSWLQRSEYYIEHRNDLRKLFGIKEIEPINNDSLVLHIRETDYKLIGAYLGYECYKKIIDKYNFNKVKIVTDNPESNCVKELVKEGCEILSDAVIKQFKIHGDKSVMNDFKTLLYSSNIGISQSSFSWWAAFLGYHNKIIFPYKTDLNWWKINPNNDEIDLYFDLPGVTDKFIL